MDTPLLLSGEERESARALASGREKKRSAHYTLGEGESEYEPRERMCGEKQI